MVLLLTIVLATSGPPLADAGVEPPVEAAPPLDAGRLLADAPTANPIPTPLVTEVDRGAASPGTVGIVPLPPEVEVAFPRMPVTRLLFDSARTMARPVVPEVSDWWIISGMFAGAVAALAVDVPVHRALQDIPDPEVFGGQISWWGSFLGEGFVDLGIVLAIGVFGGRRGMRVAYAGLEALAATAVISRAGKLFFRLERPSFDPSQHHWMRSGDAMPSGHTMSAFATAAVLASEWPQLAPLFYGLAAYVGLTRIQQSTHWLSDVVVGAALGTLFGLEAHKLTRAFELEVQPWATPAGGGLQLSRRF